MVWKLTFDVIVSDGALKSFFSALVFPRVIKYRKLGAQFVEKSVLNIEHLQLHFNIFLLFDLFDLTEVS